MKQIIYIEYYKHIKEISESLIYKYTENYLLASQNLLNQYSRKTFLLDN
jgi:hypothetical protein